MKEVIRSKVLRTGLLSGLLVLVIPGWGAQAAEKVRIIWLPHGEAARKCASLGTYGTGGFVRGCTCHARTHCGRKGVCIIYLDETAAYHLEHELAHCRNKDFH